MTIKDQIVYDASLEAARRLGREQFDGDLVTAVLDSAEVGAVMPKWGVGNLPATLISDWHSAFAEGRDEVFA